MHNPQPSLTATTRRAARRPCPRVIVRLALTGAAVAALTLGASAQADASFHYPFGSDDGMYVPVGFSVGQTEHDGAKGSMFGLELSVAQFLPKLFWVGGYTDLVWDDLRGTRRWSFGPEFGWTIFGIDGGPVLESSDDGGLRSGVQGRVMIALPIFVPYARAGWLGGRDDSVTFTELGVLFKVPIGISG